MENMKLKIQGENKYFYPDVFVTKETQTDANLYFQEHPELIIEISSPTTRIYDAVEKFIQYRKIDSLLYYILVEQDKLLVTLYSRLNATEEWQSETFLSPEDVIELPSIQISLPVKIIYNLP
jgi:Uma2 family endonuclease